MSGVVTAISGTAFEHNQSPTSLRTNQDRVHISQNIFMRSYLNQQTGVTRMKLLLVVSLIFSGSALADEVNCQTYGNDTHCTTTSSNTNTDDFTRMITRQRERDQAALNQSARGVYNAYAAKKTVVNAVLEINCGKAIKLVRVFADGKLDESDMGSVPVSDLDIATIQASLPMLQIIRGCEP